MVQKIVRRILTLLGFVSGFQLTASLMQIEFISDALGNLSTGAFGIALNIIGGIIVGLFLFMLAPFIVRLGIRFSTIVESSLANFSLQELVISTFGLIVGLI